MTVRVGIVGWGRVGSLHADAVTAHPDSVVVAVCDLDPERLSTAPVDPADRYDDWATMLDRTRLDAVIVNTPNALHRPMTEDALRRGLHVLVEKPMATTHADARAMVELADEVGRVLVVGHVQRFLPAMAAAGAAIRAGRIGQVWAIDDFRLGDYRPGHNTDWFFDRSVSGGGIMINLGAHSTDRAIWLTDSAVTAVTARLAHRYGSAVETDVRARFELSGGIEATVALSTDSPGRDAQLLNDTVAVVGEHGVVRTGNGTAWLRNDGKLEQLWVPHDDDTTRAFADQWDDVMLAVRDGSAPQVGGAHGAEVIRVIEAVYRSHVSGRIEL